ncbi:collagen alpha-2(I) chain-like [Meles meles]|uniref:collagen alpha-2(I) chain-like n=1 Tax=Meles meles TaxID=9662 RepID=UPI001E69904E|nr:collagen alpha-2(I) chain-like [Meles meles]
MHAHPKLQRQEENRRDHLLVHRENIASKRTKCSPTNLRQMVFNSISGLYPLDISSTPPFLITTNISWVASVENTALGEYNDTGQRRRRWSSVAFPYRRPVVLAKGSRAPAPPLPPPPPFAGLLQARAVPAHDLSGPPREGAAAAIAAAAGIPRVPSPPTEALSEGGVSGGGGASAAGRAARRLGSGEWLGVPRVLPGRVRAAARGPGCPPVRGRPRAGPGRRGGEAGSGRRAAAFWAGGGGGPSSWKCPRRPEGATCLRPVLRARGQRCCLPARAALSPRASAVGAVGRGSGRGRGAPSAPAPSPSPGSEPGPPGPCDTSAPPARPAPAPCCPPAPSHHAQQPTRPASCLRPVCLAWVSAARGVTLRMAEVVAGAEMPPCGAGLSQDWFGGPEIAELPLLEFCPHVVIKTPTVW